MKIQLARSAGFCFGVRRALKIAQELAGTGRRVVMLGDLVHNEEVIRDLELAGIRKIKRLEDGRNQVLLIRAHGASMRTFQNARRRGYRIVDATCPMVREIHRIAKTMERKGRTVIIIGDPRHDEVLGIMGQIRGRALVIDAKGPVPESHLKHIRKAAAVVQSTQNYDTIRPIVERLKSIIGDLVFCNTICKPTRTKQEEIKCMPLKHEVMVIIGSRTSANTKRLYEISRSINRRSYWIQSADELQRTWFSRVKTIGVTAGASTPEATTLAVIGRIRQLTEPGPTVRVSGK